MLRQDLNLQPFVRQTTALSNCATLTMRSSRSTGQHIQSHQWWLPIRVTHPLYIAIYFRHTTDHSQQMFSVLVCTEASKQEIIYLSVVSLAIVHSLNDQRGTIEWRNWVAQLTSVQKVAGSSPTASVFFFATYIIVLPTFRSGWC